MSEEETGTAGTSSGGSALKAMVSFFTIWHMDITQEDIDAMERGFGRVPLVGALLGMVLLIELVVLGAIYVHTGYGSSLLWAVLSLGTVYIGSKFIHFDGLTDFGDGMVVSGAREDHVRALKDTLVGAGGIGVALVVVLLSVATYSTAGIYIIIMAPMTEVLVKNAMVAAAAYGEPGNGMAGRQVALTTTHSLMESIVISLVAGAVLMTLALFLTDWFVVPMTGVHIAFTLVCLVIGLILSTLVGYLMAGNANRVFGMVNGDILGATNEVARPAVMLFMVLALALMLG